MPTPYTALKIASGVKALFGLAVMFVCFILSKSTFLLPLAVIGSVLGCLTAARNFGLLVKLSAAEQLLHQQPHSRLNREFRRATMPNKIFLLLFTVAEVDGEADLRARDLVRQFLLERFQSPQLIREIHSWQAKRVPADQLAELVHELRAMLTFAECETVFTWCCFVTLIDERFSDGEHEMLQQISRHFGLPPLRARQLFLFAKTQVLGAGRSSGGWGSDRRQQQHQGYQQHRNGSALSPRKRALETLGLEEGATNDQIKKRHRELAKKYHPDAHSHLGPVAAQEATERFREIQSAYETLTA